MDTVFRQKANEVLEGILLFVNNRDGEFEFEQVEKKFPHIKGKQLGSLLSAITRTQINDKRLTVAIPVFGSRRKIWKLNKTVTDKEIEQIKKSITKVLEERA